MDAKRPTPRHIIIKMLNIKRRILKAAREKQSVIYRGLPIRLSADFLKELCRLEGTGLLACKEIFKVTKSRDQDYSTQQRYHLELKSR